jgi:hypothetical protein
MGSVSLTWAYDRGLPDLLKAASVSAKVSGKVGLTTQSPLSGDSLSEGH